jgi:hypothetical protein
MEKMGFVSEPVPALPPLAWLFEGAAASPGRLLHGTAVAVHDGGFMEGCIAARAGDDPRDVANVFGSGLSMRNDKWLFVTPSHTLEALYLYRYSGGWSISNSLAFLVAYHGLVPPRDSRYGAKFASLCLGIDAYEKTLFRTTEGEVMRLAYDNVELAPDGDFLLVRKPTPPQFHNFAGYIRYLQETLGLAFADAVTPGRTASYYPLATCSTGYDSACSAALAVPLGCREAATLRNARGGEGDSGKVVGELLGLRVHEFDRPETVEGTFDEVADFLATGMGGEDYCYQGFTPLLRGRLLLTGFHGDRIWGSHTRPNTVLARGDLSGSSLQEFRLRENFVHIPVPMIGARRHPEVAAISRASEMGVYQLHNDYDRPIPRRVLEQAGVPRSLFGQRKKAASLHMFRDRRVLGAVARQGCKDVVPEPWVKGAQRSLASASWEMRYWGYRQLRQRYALSIPGSRWLRRVLVGDWRVFAHSHPLATFEFIAGLLVVARRYQRALQGHETLARAVKTAISCPTPGARTPNHST